MCAVLHNELSGSEQNNDKHKNIWTNNVQEVWTKQMVV